MKKNVLRGIVFLVVVVLLFCGLNYRFVRSDYYRSRELFMHFEKVPNNIEVASFGSSHGQYAVDFSQLPDQTGFNFGVPGQTPDLDRLMFESYMDHFDEGCVVIIPLSYFSLYLNFEGTYEAQKPLYYRYLKLTKLPEYNIRNLFFWRFFPILSSGYHIEEIFSPNGNAYFELYDGIADPDELEEMGELRAAYLQPPELNPLDEHIQGVQKILDICREHGYRPVFITTPILSYCSDWFSSEFKREFRRQIEVIQSYYPEVLYLDYSVDERFNDEYTFFYDTDHLNKAGRAYFSQILFQDLREAGYLD